MTSCTSHTSFFFSNNHDPQKLETGIHKLDNSANNFERAATDTFLIKCKDVGEMKRVQVRSRLRCFGASCGSGRGRDSWKHSY